MTESASLNEWGIAIVVVFAAWFLFAIIGAGPLAIEDINDPLPEGQARGISIAPGIPVLPAISLILYVMQGTTGRSIILWLHVALMLFCIVYHAYYALKLKQFTKPNDS